MQGLSCKTDPALSFPYNSRKTELLCTGQYKREKKLRCADCIDPVDKGAGRAAFFAAMPHIPDQVVIHIRSEHLGCEKNVSTSFLYKVSKQTANCCHEA